jgi:hypothetical protein
MSVLEKISAERRRKTGWLFPVILTVAVENHARGAAQTIERSEQLWLGGLGLAGVVAGVLWQLYSPRDLGERLLFAAGVFVLISILLLVPVGGEVVEADRSLFVWIGVISGLVIATRFTRREALSPPGSGGR